MKQRLTKIIAIITTILTLNGCSFAISNFSNNLNKAVKANNDPKTIMQGLPAYLIFLDGLIESDPEDEDLLMSSSKLINAYSALLGAELEMMSSNTEDDQFTYQKQSIKEQQKKLAIKALKRASGASCIYEDYLCDLTTLKYDEFVKRIEKIDEDDISILYGLGTAWATWLQTNTDDWNAMAQLPQIKLIMKTVIGIDEKWDHAGAHIYLGVLNSLLPVSFGGKPELGKQSFEAAISITQGKNLMAKVLYAEYYARLTFNELLHQQLITDVLSFKESPHEFILMNTIAIQKAKALQASAEDYF